MDTAKKTSSKTGTTVKKTEVQHKAVKYEDKSVGQPELVPIFENIKDLLKHYAKGSLIAQDAQAGTYSITSKEPVEILGKERELYLAGAMVQKGYVGFYYFPIYTNPEIAKDIQPELLKCLKGKSCFHIKKNDPKVLEQIEQALEVGYQFYKDKGYL